MPKNTLFLKWVLFIAFLFTLTIYGLFLGAPRWIHRSDPTHITFGILALCAGASLYLGNWYLAMSRVQDAPHDEAFARMVLPQIQESLIQGRFLAKLCQILGLFGTCIGIMRGLTAFVGVDPKNMEQVSDLFASINVNMSTVFLTTAAGIAASVIIDTQCHVLGIVMRRRGIR